MNSLEVNLFVLGAAKCGTTTIHNALAQHPDILMSKPKEPFFFETEYEQGRAYYLRKYFSQWDGQSLLGESRHRNLYLPFVPDRIFSMFPDARFVVVLRHPIDRAMSHWWHWRSRGVELRTFEAAARENIAQLNTGRDLGSPELIAEYARTLDRSNGYSPMLSYIDSSFYAEQIQRYIDRFGRNRIHVIMFDEFAEAPSEHVEGIFNFLGLPSIESLSVEKMNASMSPAGVQTVRFLSRTRLGRLFPKSIRGKLGSSVRRAFSPRLEKPEISDKLRQDLLLCFDAHTCALEELLDVQLPEWKR